MSELYNRDVADSPRSARPKGFVPYQYQEVDVARGERISAAMMQSNMQYNCQLSYTIGVSESTLSRWRKGLPLSLKHAVALSDKLGISLDHLLTGASLNEQREAVSSQIMTLCGNYSRLSPNNQHLLLSLLRRLTLHTTGAVSLDELQTLAK